MAGSPSLERHPGVDEWLALERDGRVVVRTGKVDIGQRISTAIARIAAAELGVALERVEVLRPATGSSPDEGITSGSNSMEESGEAVRLAAATARRRLLELAAATLEADPATLEVVDGLVRSRQHNRSVTYWDLVPEGRLALAVDPSVPTAPPAAYAQLGTDAASGALADLVTGRAVFVQDLSVPGMLHARVVRPPHYHARLTGLAHGLETHLETLDAYLVRDGSFLAVAHQDEYQAVKAAARVAASARWSHGPGLEPQEVHERLVSNPRLSLPVVDGRPLDEPVPPPGRVPEAAVNTLRARYARPYQMHGSIGPSAALAHQTSDGLTVWTHSQGIYPLRDSLSEALGLDPASVEVRHVPGAGCYGHNGADDAALDAVLVARALPGDPILLKWTRDDEHAWEPYGPAMVVDLEASLDADGRVVAWSHDGYSDTHRGRPRQGPNRAGPARLLAMRHVAEAVPAYVAAPNTGRHAGIHRNADPLYAFARKRIVKHLVRELPLRVSALRTLGAFANVFAIESFMDELAEVAGADPLEFRLRHLDDARARAVLEAVAGRFAWPAHSPSGGRGHGLAFAQYKNAKTYAAVAVELEVDDAACVRLHRAVVAADAGQVVDPAGLRAQLEGGLVQAASWTLHEEVTFDAGGITSRDWDSYPILRFDNVPEIEVVLLDRPGEPFLGAGEASSGPTAAAIANAIHRATGLRLRRLPFTPDAIRAAALA
jgi:CO/xanthine dehydrogenase Mo-binding subunit